MNWVLMHLQASITKLEILLRNTEVEIIPSRPRDVTPRTVPCSRGGCPKISLLWGKQTRILLWVFQYVSVTCTGNRGRAAPSNRWVARVNGTSAPLAVILQKKEYLDFGALSRVAPRIGDELRSVVKLHEKSLRLTPSKVRLSSHLTIDKVCSRR